MKKAQIAETTSRIRQRVAIAALVLAVLGASADQPASAKSKLFEIKGAYQVEPAQINNSGWIAGEYAGRDNDYHGFLRDPSGNSTEIGADGPGCISTMVAGLNVSNTVIGWEFDTSCVQHGFLRTADGTITTFDEPGATSTGAVSINDAGVICGEYKNQTGYFGFVRSSDGTMTSIDVPGSTGTYAAMINNKNEIVGFYLDQQLIGHGFIRTAQGKITSFDPPNSSDTEPTSISDSSDTAGLYQDETGYHGFIRKSDGTFIIVDPNGTGNVNLTSINKKGVAIGYSGNFVFARERDGTIDQIKVNRAKDIYPASINANGFVTGYVFLPTNRERGFIYEIPNH